MEQKLQELLDKVYNEGVAKGQEVADAIVSDAGRQAEHLLAEARKEAAAIRHAAQEEAEELKRNVASELRLSANQLLGALQQKISGLIIAKAVSEPLDQTFSDREFLRKIIEKLIENWRPDADGPVRLSLLLPEKEEAELGRYFEAKAREALDQSLEVRIDGKLDNGFRIGPADGSYQISFSKQDFEHFFADYLRPKTKALLYGDQ